MQSKLAVVLLGVSMSPSWTKTPLALKLRTHMFLTARPLTPMPSMPLLAVLPSGVLAFLPSRMTFFGFAFLSLPFFFCFIPWIVRLSFL